MRSSGERFILVVPKKLGCCVVRCTLTKDREGRLFSLGELYQHRVLVARERLAIAFILGKRQGKREHQGTSNNHTQGPQKIRPICDLFRANTVFARFLNIKKCVLSSKRNANLIFSSS